jgi:hypothetical protein
MPDINVSPNQTHHIKFCPKKFFNLVRSYNSGGGTNKMTDFGPGDTGHEMHAKMEEAVEHALGPVL